MISSNLRRLVMFLFLYICLPSLGFSQKICSQLWGIGGEKWDKAKLPDFTQAGYKKGKENFSAFSTSVDVKDYGAVGDGRHNDTKAFRAAIKACGEKTTLSIPEGKYLLSDSLMICQSRLSIKGAGQGKTFIIFTKGLEELYPNYNKDFKNQTKWSWSGAMILFKGKITDCSLENLTVQFPDDSLWAGHNWHERGYNAVGFSNGANNNWIKNITITGCDVGIWIEGSANHITAENWVLDFGPKRSAQKISGHHGVNIYGSYNLLEHFQIKGKCAHDLSVESKSSMFNVFRDGKGTDLCIDHHNHAQSNNLFTNLNAGMGSRLYSSGGVDTPRGISFKETYWNIRGDAFMSYCDQWDTAQGQSANNICVGIKTKQLSKLNDAKNNWFESIDPSSLSPSDLYEAEMEVKNKPSGQ